MVIARAAQIGNMLQISFQIEHLDMVALCPSNRVAYLQMFVVELSQRYHRFTMLWNELIVKVLTSELLWIEELEDDLLNFVHSDE